MPLLAGEFGREVDRAVDIARAGETIRAGAPAGSVARRELTSARIAALYELAYLRVFIAWEQFLEESFFRYLCGYASAAGPPVLLQAPFRSIVDARAAVLGGQQYVSWADPRVVEQRSRAFMQNGLHEVVVRASRARLQAFAAVRNRIAHGSAYARAQFDRATMAVLAGRRYRGSIVGSFLRDWRPHSLPAERWLQSIGLELKNLATQVTP
jgi:hypothetical protein